MSARLAVGIDIPVFYLAPVNLESELIGIADFAICHVHFDDAETVAEIGIFTIYIDIVYRFIAGGSSRIVIRKVLNFEITAVHQVDIGISVENQQASGSLVVGDVLDIAVAQIVYLAEGLDTLVVPVVDI